jgi:8-amino-7-oxononanoate synthase
VSAPIIVVTGIDTEVGKTHTACALAAALTARGHRVIAIKPAETGCGPERTSPEDGAQLAQATGQPWPLHALTRLATPVAPPIAADMEGATLDPASWRDAIRNAAQQADLVIVEGAGGLLSPLAWGYSLRELAQELNAHVLLVAANRLGCLNHTLLTLEALEAARLPILGVIFNDAAPQPSDASRASNLAALARLRPSLPICAVDHQPRWQLNAPAMSAACGWIEPLASRTAQRWQGWAEQVTATRQQAGLLRRLTPISAADGLHDAQGRVLFSSNDYLGLSSHPEVREAAARAAQDLGMGPRGSALICGYTDHHAALEAELAALKGCQAALLTPTGYAANMAAIGALAGQGVAFFSDALNHACIIDGLRLARAQGATVHVYPHADAEALEALMAASGAPRKVIISDAIFSMDGDGAPLAHLARLKLLHNALLVLDEAHGTLVYGPRGEGYAAHCGLADVVDLHVGTLSKAFGAQGGFIACSAAMRAAILNLGRPQIYSTALPVPTVAAARAALAIATRDDAPRLTLSRHIKQLSEALDRPISGPIVPVILGDEQNALAAAASLWDAGLHVSAIRPPTVPRGTARLRITLSAGHSHDEIERLADALASLGKRIA